MCGDAVFYAIADAKSARRDLACQLGISANRVREHVKAIYGKLGAANRAEAVALACRKQLV